MTDRYLVFLALLLLSFIICVQSSSHEETKRRLQHCPIECLIDVVGFLYSEEEADKDNVIEKNGDEMYLCRLQNNNHSKNRAGYRIELPDSFTKEHHKILASAEAIICISDGKLDRRAYRIVIGEDADISLVHHNRKNRRNLESITGTRSVLAVQLSTTFMTDAARQYEDPGLTPSEIEGSIFGTGPDAPAHDLVSQYKACSFGALNLQPAVGQNIENGVAQVRLRKPIAGGEILGSLQDDILEATEEVVGSLDQYDHIIYCIPDDALMDGAAKWTAFTYFHSHWAFFQKRRCSAMSVTIHELGHNLGFRHSGYQSEAYGDESGYMGFTVYEKGGPIKCFNGAKNWLAGWFQGRKGAIDPTMSEPVLRRLVSFVDYDNPDLESQDIVVMRIGRYYIQYNRAKGINVDTGMHADKVTITYAKDAASDSESIAGLAAGQQAVLPDFRNTGYNLTVEVCEFGIVENTNTDDSLSVVSMARQAIFDSNESSSSYDYAWVSIHLENGQQQSQCYRVETAPQPTAQLTPLPTSRRASSPSLRPSLAPSIRPSTVESASPTLSPSPSSSLLRTSTQPVLARNEMHQKKKRIPSIRDVDRLVKEDEDEGPATRRRLKGRDP